MTLTITAATDAIAAVGAAGSIAGATVLHLVPPMSPPVDSPRAADRHLGRLAAAVQDLAAIDPGRLGTADSLAVARAVEAVARAADGALIRCVRTWQDRGDPVQTPDTTAEELNWRAADAARKALVVGLGLSRVEAGRLLATAKALRRDPPTEEVLRDGRISAPQARIIAEAMTTLAHLPGEAADAARTEMLNRAQARGTEDLRDHAEDVAHRRSPATVLSRARVTEAKRAFHLTPALDGYVPGGFLPTADGDAVLTVLDALATVPGAGEEEGQARVRADALVTLAESHLRSGTLPQRRTCPTAVTIVMRADTALGLPDAPPARTGYGRTLPGAEAHRMVCESALRAVLVNGEGEILWQGRKRRLATRAQYEALAVRDGGCTHPQCNRPAPECDAHHLVPWQEGGHTDLDQLRLLCRRHHREVHDELWQRQFGWQEAEVRRRNELRKAAQPRMPWYTDTPPWYPAPSPWQPDAVSDDAGLDPEEADEGREDGAPIPLRPGSAARQKVTATRGKEVSIEGGSHTEAA